NRRLSCPTLFPYTTLFRSTQRLSSFRPKVPIWGVTNSEAVMRRMCLMWGVSPMIILQNDLKTDEVEKTITDRLVATHELKKEDRSEEHTSELQSRENLVCR